MLVNAPFDRFENLEPSLRHRILEAAVREFGRFGYGAASMNRLVKEAAISKGAIFKYFGTKARLFDYVYRTCLEEVKEQLRTVRDESRNDPFFSRLERTVRAGLIYTAQRPLSAAIYYRVIYTGDAPHGKRILEEIQATSRRFLISLIQVGVRSGDLRENLDVEKTAFIIQSILDRFLQAHYLEFMTKAIEGPGDAGSLDPETNTEKWIREIMDLVKYGLIKK